MSEEAKKAADGSLKDINYLLKRFYGHELHPLHAQGFRDNTLNLLLEAEKRGPGEVV